jgi:hypothetical protein
MTSTVSKIKQKRTELDGKCNDEGKLLLRPFFSTNVYVCRCVSCSRSEM